MASSAACFKRIIEILNKWPVDLTKSGGRDYSEFLTAYVNKAYKDNKFETNYSHWDRQYFAIQKLLNNTNRNKYPRSLSSSSTGLTAEQCNLALSKEILEEIKREETPFFQKLFKRN